MWSPPLKNYRNVNTIVGLGYDPVADPDKAYSFVNTAYEAGYLLANTFSFQGHVGDSRYAHLTLGGYLESDLSGDVEWYDMSSLTDGHWKLPISTFTIDGIDLLAAPTTTNDDGDASNAYVGEEVTFPSYAHFNSGYPFLGVDEATGQLLYDDLKQFRPDLDCDYDADYNPWGICYYPGKCDDSAFGTAIQINFGSNGEEAAQFSIPISVM